MIARLIKLTGFGLNRTEIWLGWVWVAAIKFQSKQVEGKRAWVFCELLRQFPPGRSRWGGGLSCEGER